MERHINDRYCFDQGDLIGIIFAYWMIVYLCMYIW
jgi:hypothetical protein